MNPQIERNLEILQEDRRFWNGAWLTSLVADGVLAIWCWPLAVTFLGLLSIVIFADFLSYGEIRDEVRADEPV